MTITIHRKPYTCTGAPCTVEIDGVAYPTFKDASQAIMEAQEEDYSIMRRCYAVKGLEQ